MKQKQKKLNVILNPNPKKYELYRVKWKNNNMKIYYEDGEIIKFYNVQRGVAAGLITAPNKIDFIMNNVSKQYEMKIIKSTLKTKKDTHSVYPNATCLHLFISDYFKLNMNKDTNLWVTNRPDLIPKDLKEKYFTQI